MAVCFGHKRIEFQDDIAMPGSKHPVVTQFEQQVEIVVFLPGCTVALVEG
jgi:hypothetical protein